MTNTQVPEVTKEFTANWFDGPSSLFRHFLMHLANTPNLAFLEVGAFEGKGTCWILDNLLTHPTSTLTSIDSWLGGFEHADLNMKEIFDRFKKNTKDYGSDKLTIMDGFSFDQLVKLNSDPKNKEKYDFIYIDGGHAMRNVIEDSTLCFPLLKKGGILAFDDYLWGIPTATSKGQPPHRRPYDAINSFLLGYQEELDVLYLSGQVWVKKK
jgi:predicted O-methyltransferase YrrM